jgi:hypothetical protein
MTDEGLYDDESQPDWHSEQRRRRHDWADDPDRRLSLTVRCRHCGASIGVVCRNTHAGRFGAILPFDEAPELTHLPAHPIRITDAKRGPKEL